MERKSVNIFPIMMLVGTTKVVTTLSRLTLAPKEVQGKEPALQNRCYAKYSPM
jgi:hypothetical protein